MSVVICPGSFDPVTNGHIDVILRARALASEVIVAVANNPKKQYRFSVSERLSFLETVFAHEDGISVAVCSGLVAEFAKQCQASAIVKGIRGEGDVAGEIVQAQVNRQISGVETVFIPAAQSQQMISSSLVKELAEYGNYSDAMVPPVVAAALHQA